jgi:hypothetical protein
VIYSRTNYRAAADGWDGLVLYRNLPAVTVGMHAGRRRTSRVRVTIPLNEIERAALIDVVFLVLIFVLVPSLAFFLEFLFSEVSQAFIRHKKAAETAKYAFSGQTFRPETVSGIKVLEVGVR